MEELKYRKERRGWEEWEGEGEGAERGRRTVNSKNFDCV